MDTVDTAALVLAALEIAPCEPADLTALLRDENELAALLSLDLVLARQPLTSYLIEMLDHGRVEHWRKALDRDVRREQRYHVVLVGGAGYPPRLALVWDAPPVLFVRGTLPDRSGSAVAVIGSRRADERTLNATEELAAELAAQGVEIVSGLALGVDGAAHRGALRTGRTTAVMGAGIQNVTPTEHADLAEAIVARGALVSEFTPHAPRTRTTFLRRNGTIAGLSELLVVMGAAMRSGSRQAVGRALEYGRPVLMWEETLAREPWARELASTGRARFFRESKDVRAALYEVSP
jgi:DNA processing protein